MGTATAWWRRRLPGCRHRSSAGPGPGPPWPWWTVLPSSTSWSPKLPGTRPHPPWRPWSREEGSGVTAEATPLPTSLLSRALPPGEGGTGTPHCCKALLPSLVFPALGPVPLLSPVMRLVGWGPDPTFAGRPRAGKGPRLLPRAVKALPRRSWSRRGGWMLVGSFSQLCIGIKSQGTICREAETFI